MWVYKQKYLSLQGKGMDTQLDAFFPESKKAA
jgi:hypothetical protein